MYKQQLHKYTIIHTVHSKKDEKNPSKDIFKHK